jgi:hypothetical protein
MTIGRVLSLIVAACWLIIALALAIRAPSPKGAAFLLTAAPVLLWLGTCLAMIWFGDAIGSIPVRGHFPAETPGIFVKAAGWIFLFLPVLMPLIGSNWKVLSN